MKVVFIGAEFLVSLKFRGYLIKDLIELGHEVYLLGNDINTINENQVKMTGASPISYSLNRSSMNPLLDIKTLFELYRLLRKINPDAMISYFSKPVILGNIAGWLSGIRNRITMLEGLGYVFIERTKRTTFKQKILKKIQVFLYKISLPLSNTLVLLNKDDKIDLIDKYRIKVRSVVILGGIGIDFNDYPKSEPCLEPVTFIFIGRLIVEKGILDFLESAKEIKMKYPTTRFFVIGGIDESNPGSIRMSDLELYINRGIVTYFGQVPDVASFLVDSSVFVLPSYREGFPRSTQEAMAIGRPVITTNVPGCRETVIEGVNGFFVPKMSPDKIAEKMSWFIENPEQIKKMGLESYRMAKDNFDVKVVNKKFFEIFGI